MPDPSDSPQIRAGTRIEDLFHSVTQLNDVAPEFRQPFEELKLLFEETGAILFNDAFAEFLDPTGCFARVLADYLPYFVPVEVGVALPEMTRDAPISSARLARPETWVRFLHYRPQGAEFTGLTGNPLDPIHRRVPKLGAKRKATAPPGLPVLSKPIVGWPASLECPLNIDIHAPKLLFVSAPPDVLRDLPIADRRTVFGTAHTAIAEVSAFSSLAQVLSELFRRRGGEILFGMALVGANWQARYVKQQAKEQHRDNLRRYIDDRLGPVTDLRVSDAFAGFPEVRQEFGQELKERLEERVSRVTRLLDQAGPEERRAFVAALREELNSLNLRVVCPACEQPAILRFGRTGTAKNGAFFFEHSTGGRQTSHGVTTAVPAIILVAKPPDKRLK